MTASFPTSIAGYGQNDFHTGNNLGASKLSSTINAIVTSFSVNSASVASTWPTANFAVKMENEVLFVATRSGTSCSGAVRGFGGTTAASHAGTTTDVFVVRANESFLRMEEEVIAIETALGINLTNVLTPTNTKVVTNKSLSDSTTYVVDAADNTKRLQFDVGGTTGITGTIRTAFTTAKTWDIPDATDTAVGKATTDNLSNKTIIDPSNSVRATELATTGASVVISGATPGIAGQVLKLTSATAASWQDDNTGGGSGASVGASYLQLSLDGTNTSERVFTPGNGLLGTDGGANQPYTLDLVLASGSNLATGGSGLDWTGLTVQDAGSTVATRPKVNFIEGANISLTIAEDVGNDRVDVTIESTGGGGGGAPTSASYLVLGLDASLTQDRAFVAGTGLSATDLGANNTYTLAINQAFSPTWTGTHSFQDTKFFIRDISDDTKRIKFDVAGTTGVDGTFATAFTTSKTITYPDATGTVILTTYFPSNSQTNALIAPVDTPTNDTMRIVTDGTFRVIWTYIVSEASWKGVQVV